MNTELAMRTNGAAVVQAVGELDVMTLGTVLAKSGYFKDVREQAQAVVKILAGAEMGFKPIAAMMGVHFFEGKPTIGANLIAAAIKGSRKYDYRILTHTPDACELAILQGGQEIGRSGFTRDEAQQAGLLGKDNWRKYPKSMLFARAISNAAKWHCPDIFGGVTVYTPDEMGQETDEDGNAFAPTFNAVVEPPTPIRQQAAVVQIIDPDGEPRRLERDESLPAFDVNAAAERLFVIAAKGTRKSDTDADDQAWMAELAGHMETEASRLGITLADRSGLKTWQAGLEWAAASLQALRPF